MSAMPYPEDRPKVIRSAPADVADRLDELGINVEDLNEAARQGIGQRATYTEFDPPSSRGIGTWGRTVRTHRERLSRRDWFPQDTANYSITVHPSKSHALAAATGNENTGLVDGEPKTRSPKGKKTQDAIKGNLQRQFHEVFPDFPAPPDGLLPMETWIHLVCYREKAEVISHECSLPWEIDEEKRVTKWAERIILPNIPFSGPIVGARFDDDDQDDGDVLVERRGS